ncbi:MAG: acyl-protein synthetase [Rhodospirillaceae bacterium]|nr:acyl-protein synthetase [Rhodospirillaceae bacterium]
MPDIGSDIDPFAIPPYGLAVREKDALLCRQLNRLTRHHRQCCAGYRAILDALGRGCEPAFRLEDVPFLPAALFKLSPLQSVPDYEVVQVLTSSGTSGRAVSRVALDQRTAASLTRALVTVVTTFIGKRRLPMVIVDGRESLGGDGAASASAAAVRGFVAFGRDHLFLLGADGQPDWPALEAFLDRHRDETKLVFGFTYMVWRHLYQAARSAGRRFDLGPGILIHGGGWKRLQDEAVSNAGFRAVMQDVFDIAAVHNYYGMVEQVGAVFMECDHGRLHAPVFSDVLIRDPLTLAPVPLGQPGLIQVMSLLPESYPGHCLLTEDLGAILGEDDCPCGRPGRTFRVDGRLPAAELRGCSDTRPL